MIYDLGIVGGGPAGYSAALEAIKCGLSVILFEKENLGGTCLNRGCVPTKFLANIAEGYSEITNLKRYGVECASVTVDYAVTKRKMDDTVSLLRDGLEKLLRANDITIIEGDAQAHKDGLIVCGGAEYKVKDILLCTGSTQAEPIINGAISSDDLLALSDIPQSILVIGGGVIAVEFASILNKLGCDVTIAIRGERILRKWDKEIAVGVTQQFKRDGIHILTRCQFDNLEAENYDVILSAIGRIPSNNCINDLGIECDAVGGIIVDEFGMTNIDHVYAAGDVISGGRMLAHTAMEQGKNIVRKIAGKKCTKSVVVECIYISPEIASVGLTEKDAKEQGINVVCGKVNMNSNARTCISTQNRCFIKLVVDATSHFLIGAQLMCERASDIASELLVVINNYITIDKYKESLHPHPSYSEAIVDAIDVTLKKINEV